MQRNKILEICVVVSLLIHTGIFTYVQKNCFLRELLEPDAEKDLVIDRVAPDQILKEAFEVEPEAMQFIPQEESLPSKVQESIVALEPVPTYSFSLPAPITSEPLLAIEFVPTEFPLPQIQSFDLQLPKQLLTLPSTIKAAPEFFPLAQTTAAPKGLAPLAPSAPEVKVEFPQAGPEEMIVKVTKPTLSIPLPNLPHLPSLADLETINLSDAFDSELTFLPKPDGTGYIFALTLIPNPDLKLPKMQQNLLFLIDHSNSIQKERLHLSKNAIRKVVEELDAEDRFNVIAFDSKMDKSFPGLTPSTQEAKLKAVKFLEQLTLGSIFSQGDLFKPLFLTIPSFVPEDELYTAIILTDGESLGKKQAARSLLRDWTLQNKQKVELYAVSLSTDQNLTVLDAACALNHGKLFTSTTNRGLKRKLLRLVKNIQHPVAKNITLTSISKTGNVEVKLCNASATLYLDQPYVVLGEVKTLDDCILFLQGRLKDRWLNVKKNICFLHAKKANSALSAQWALEQAYRQYEQYVVDENPKHFAEARHLLEPFNIQAVQ